MSDREIILGRVRAALADVAPGEPSDWEPRAATDATPGVPARELATAELAALFAQRCGEYRANVVRCSDNPESIAGAIAAACERHDAGTLACPSDLDREWRPPGAALRDDDPPLSLEALDHCDGVVSGCALAIALTGTIALDGGRAQGRRVLSLIPDLHICVVRSGQIVPGVPDALAALAPAIREGHPITLISGPSATSDIELRRVEGVHGPRRLEVIVAAGSN